jgi:hypothetical protein
MPLLRAVPVMLSAGERTALNKRVHIWRVQGGKIVEHAASRNDLLLVNQLGLVSGTQPITEATWRKPVTPGSGPSG